MLKERLDKSYTYADIENSDDFIEFIELNFSLSENEGISIERNILLSEINKYEYRKTPQYLRFLTRILLIAAEFGYPRLTWVTGGFIRERDSNDKILDVFEPRFLVWLAYLLANNTLRLWSQKMEMLKLNIRNSDEVFFEILGASENPVGGAIQLNKDSQDRRKSEGLHSLIPDFNMLKNILSIETAIDSRITTTVNPEFKDRKTQYLKDLETLSKDEYFRIYGPILEIAFVNSSLNEVFL